jgi:hypothetical protein
MLSTSAEAGPTRHGEKKKRMRCGGGAVASLEPSAVAVASQVRVGRPPDMHVDPSAIVCTHALILGSFPSLFIYAQEVFVILPHGRPHMYLSIRMQFFVWLYY